MSQGLNLSNMLLKLTICANLMTNVLFNIRENRTVIVSKLSQNGAKVDLLIVDESIEMADFDITLYQFLHHTLYLQMEPHGIADFTNSSRLWREWRRIKN